MRWNFGGNLQPVRMICEYDWKECPIAVVSYVWSEIVTDVLDGITGEAYLWRILAVVLLCSVLLHTVYYKTRCINRSEHDDLIKVGFKMQDLELKINILTYKMQYGTWPLPHEIPTPSLNDLRNVKLTLSNTSRHNMWTKHHLHGYISKCLDNSEENKSMHKLLSTGEDLDLNGENFFSKFGSRNDRFEKLKSQRNLKILHREDNCKDYERLIKTAGECRRYMDEINESNKSLGLFDNSSDISDQNSTKEISAGTESDQNSHRFLIDPKKWQEIYKCKNREAQEVSESELTASNQLFSTSNLNNKNSIFSADDKRYPLKSSNRSRLLPPGLSITFLSDKFKTFGSSSDKCVSAEGEKQSRNKTTTNETLNKVKEKLESLHDIKHAMKSSKSLSNVDEKLDSKKNSETSLSIKKSSKINSGTVKSLPKIIHKEENLAVDSDSSNSFVLKSNFVNKNVVRSTGNNINLNINLNNKLESISKTNMSYVLPREAKSVRQTPMETDEDGTFVSQTSSQTELSKDSDTDEKSTTTLLREAIDFKKALLLQIQRENEISEEKSVLNESSEYESDDTSRCKTDNHFRSKILDIISEEQSAGSSTEKTSRTYILSRSINETNLCQEPGKYLNKNNQEDLKCDRVVVEGDLKSTVTASSSEYFSTNNITDNEHTSAQKISQCLADGDVLRELELNEFDAKEEKNAVFNHKSNAIVSKESQENLVEQENVNKIEESMKERRETPLEVQLDSVADKIVTKSEGKIKFFKSLSSINSENGISWNSISESSSSESISQFVNALASIESKNIDVIAKQKLMMLNSTDYEGRNFATAGEDLRYSLNPQNRKQPSFVSLLDVNTSEQRNGVIEDILEMIADSEIFKLDKPESKEETTSVNNTAANNRSESSNLYNSHSVMNLDQEKLQRKQDIFSKLRTLDAFTKPLDISECNSEKNEYDGDSSPLTDRTVVYTCKSSGTNVNESFNKAESDFLKDKSSGCIDTPLSNLILDVSNSEDKLFEAKSQQLVSETELNERKGAEKSLNTKLQSRKATSNTKRNQLSKSSITNFSTDTSDSYFDVSNHDFAVSSIILTSQNSNLVYNQREDLARSDTSSSYVDASDYSSTLPSNSSSTEGNATSNLSAEKNYLSESQVTNVNTTVDTEIPIKDVKAQNNLDSKQESLTKTQLIAKYTSSLPSNDKKCELNSQLCAQSSISLNQHASKYCSSSINSERSYSKSRSTSRSCIPILKSRIETPRREKSMEAKARSRSPVRRSNTPTIQGAESNCQIERTASVNNENEKRIRKSNYGSKRSLNSKHSYTLPSEISNTKQEDLNAKSASVENKEKPKLVSNLGKLTKECTVIYINIISDSDQNEGQNVDAKELTKYVDEKELISCDKKLDPKCQSLSARNLKSERSSEGEYGTNVLGPSSDSKLCKNVKEKASTMTTASSEAEGKDLSIANDLERFSPPSESVTKTADKLLSTSTLELPNSPKIEQREMEVLAKPSVQNTSTSVSDFPDASPKNKRSFYNPKNEVFDLSQDLVQKEQIVLSEMLTTDPNFYECRKTHRLYNKLGLGLKDQTDQL